VYELIGKRWQKNGKDRLYVNRVGAGGASVAWLDLQTGELHVTDLEYEMPARATISAWLKQHDLHSATSPPLLAASIPPLPPLTTENDLLRNRPGAAVEQKVREIEQQHNAFVRWLARTFNLSMGAEDWCTGLVGERVVGEALARLVDHGWYVLHAIQWPSGADIDHLVIGPSGVFTVNAKHHAGARVWVGDKSLRLNNRSTDHLRLSLSEADRVTKVLQRWCGWDVPVRPVIALVGARSITLGAKESPRVLVVDGTEVDKHLIRLPGIITPPHRVSSVFEVARRRDVWLSAPKRSSRG
jgi:hypothetical protein